MVPDRYNGVKVRISAKVAAWTSLLLFILYVTFAPIRFIVNLIKHQWIRLFIKAVLTLGLSVVLALEFGKQVHTKANEAVKAGTISTYINEDGNEVPDSASYVFNFSILSIAAIGTSWLLIGSGRKTMPVAVVSKEKAMRLIQAGQLVPEHYDCPIDNDINGGYIDACENFPTRNTKVNREVTRRHFYSYPQHEDNHFLSCLGAPPVLVILYTSQFLPCLFAKDANPNWPDYLGRSVTSFVERVWYFTLSDKIDMHWATTWVTIPILALIFTGPISLSIKYVGGITKNILLLDYLERSAHKYKE